MVVLIDLWLMGHNKSGLRITKGFLILHTLYFLYGLEYLSKAK